MSTKFIKPMLASNTTLENLKYPIVVSHKMDGVRALIYNNIVYSRTGKPIPNKYVQNLFSKYNGLDGELIVGEPTSSTCYKDTVSGVMSQEGEPNVIFFAFDCWYASGGIYERYKELTKILTPIPKDIFITPQSLCNNKEEVLKLEEYYVSLGFEGIILRDINASYKYGRSTLKEASLLKYKRFKDSEAIIIDCIPLAHNNNEPFINELGYTERSTKKDNLIFDNKLGSFIVRDLKSNVMFNVGSGFTDKQRIDYWNDKNLLINKIIKYKYFEIGMQDYIPRFPIFLGFRDRIDIV